MCNGYHIKNRTPLFPLEEVKDSLLFPHGISFSPDGQFFFVTQFGSIRTTYDDDLDWNILPPPSDTKVHMYTHYE